MVTIVNNPITYLAPKLGTIILMTVILWYFSSQKSSDGISITSTDACLYFAKQDVVIIRPCLPGDNDITKIKKIGQKFYDLYKYKPLLLLITVPSDMIFENLYVNVIFSWYAKQYYFPEISDDYEYVIYKKPSRSVGGYSFNYVSTCNSFGRFWYKTLELTLGIVEYNANACVVE